jgi:hypothetical protein
MDALGTADLDFYGSLIDQLASAAALGGQIDERRLNFMLSVVKDVEPKDQLEAMLAAQMGRCPCGDDNLGSAIGHGRNLRATRQCRACFQQARPDIHGANGGA